jgi:fermentation-respiration switch protein FrsA (DUF1100 family)
MSAAAPHAFSALDRPEVLSVLFHPRADVDNAPLPPPSQKVMIPVERDVAVGGCFHVGDPAGTNILFFHGNGEIASDYDELGPLYSRMGINFLAVDYRGYGRSTGHPTVSAMMKDCHVVLDWVVGWLGDHGHSGRLAVMGRSLGSASALELAHSKQSLIAGLIVESGFAHAAPLLRLLGISPEAIGFREEHGFGNLEKMASWDKPTLVIHAEYDHIIPFPEGQAIFNACPAAEKALLKVPGANHNDIFVRALPDYLAAVNALAQKLRR